MRSSSKCCWFELGSADNFLKLDLKLFGGVQVKRLVVCCDGTWQSLKKGANPTNIFKLAQAIKPVIQAGADETE
jgi:uncharacterized protein (DUF2235 family)